MNTIRDFISRLNKQALAGVFCLLAGISFIAMSGAFLHAIIRIAGAIVAIASAVRFVYAIRQYSGPVMTVTVINSILLFLVGLVMLVKPGGALELIYVAIGAYLMINAITHIYRFALAPKRLHSPSWWIEIFTSSLILVLGFRLAFAPGTALRLTEIIAGISLIIKSIELFGRAYNERSRRKNEKSGDVEADFVDKSHEL